MTRPSLLVIGEGDHKPGELGDGVLKRARRFFSHIAMSANDYSEPGILSFPLGLRDDYLRGYEQYLMELIEHPPAKNRLLLAAWGAKWPRLNEWISDRTLALEFLAQATVGDYEVLGVQDYLTELARSRYMLYPRGAGIQSPKGVEALLLGTIPIVTRHPLFEELRERGMPLLIVDHWQEVTEDFLEEQWPALSNAAEEFKLTLMDLDKWWDFSFPGFRRK